MRIHHGLAAFVNREPCRLEHPRQPPRRLDKTKYLAVHYHYVREKIEWGEIEDNWLGTSQNVADTNALVPAVHDALRDQLCLC
jgi:hypothetical protein